MDEAGQQRLGVALALSAALLWGVSGAVAADAFSDISPARVAQARALQEIIADVATTWPGEASEHRRAARFTARPM